MVGICKTSTLDARGASDKPSEATASPGLPNVGVCHLFGILPESHVAGMTAWLGTLIQTFPWRWSLRTLGFQWKVFCSSPAGGRMRELEDVGEQVCCVGERLGEEMLGES